MAGALAERHRQDYLEAVANDRLDLMCEGEWNEEAAHVLKEAV